MEKTLNHRPGTISDALDKEDLSKPEQVDRVMMLARKCAEELSHLESYWGECRKAKGTVISESETEIFFRSRERNNNVCLIIQYLQFFVEKLPDEEEIASAPVNPFSQMISFIDYACELLNAEDVINAALAINRDLGLVTDITSWYYRGRVELIYREMKKRLKLQLQPEKAGYTVLLDLLQDLCCFWFAFRNENHHKVRKSDICIYQLCSLIRSRYQLPPYRKKTI